MAPSFCFMVGWSFVGDRWCRDSENVEQGDGVMEVFAEFLDRGVIGFGEEGEDLGLHSCGEQ